MALSDYITDEIKQQFEEETGLKGKAARKILRNMVKRALNPIGNLKQDSYNIVKIPRQERKALAKKLKVPFEPRYNGPIFTVIYSIGEDGNMVTSYKEIEQ